MPTINIYYEDSSKELILRDLLADFRNYLAKELSCGEISLGIREISIRLIKTSGGMMIGDLEIEIKAHSFSERVKNQDEICLKIRDYLQNKYPALGNIKVWLQLSELGHSWSNPGN
jgi:hypothetical protein